MNYSFTEIQENKSRTRKYNNNYDINNVLSTQKKLLHAC